jgi:DNA gyrase/topoisomerase IV subunit A
VIDELIHDESGRTETVQEEKVMEYTVQYPSTVKLFSSVLYSAYKQAMKYGTHQRQLYEANSNQLSLTEVVIPSIFKVHNMELKKLEGKAKGRKAMNVQNKIRSYRCILKNSEREIIAKVEEVRQKRKDQLRKERKELEQKAFEEKEKDADERKQERIRVKTQRRKEKATEKEMEIKQKKKRAILSLVLVSAKDKGKALLKKIGLFVSYKMNQCFALTFFKLLTDLIDSVRNTTQYNDHCLLSQFDYPQKPFFLFHQPEHSSLPFSHNNKLS